MGHGRRKKRTHLVPADDDQVPRSLVVKSGHVGRTVAALVQNVRQVMEPYTAVRLRERPSNKIKDYQAVSNQLGLTHLLLFSQTTSTNLRIARFPRGPTLYFRVEKYSLAKEQTFLTPPLVLLNNFGQGNEFKLMTAMLQNMFPAINPSTMPVARRVVLFNYQEDTGIIDFRHYAIKIKPAGVTKGVKRVKGLPSLGKYDDISEYVLQEAVESDAEDHHEQQAVRLIELGPRMDLRLVKIEDGLCGGKVLYHNHIHKSPEEIALQDKQHQQNIDSSDGDGDDGDNDDEMESSSDDAQTQPAKRSKSK
ncbi:rRNA-binding ribosome biosynthesis protein [Coemansia brasiliensis]|uniref:rRNA-binding ribosome biosynthesis protein n=1 Tax=Coemansia brasiliensis TaxID=2650707 RepID=A0A9W8M0C2_9FUNG|nr:rRNA-binding ribosome biosynthesis protein [Coemansia brasiliensis]